MTHENETNFSEILQTLTTELKSEPLKREEDGRVLFALDDKLGVALFTVDAEEAQVDAVIAVIALGPAPDSDAAILRKLLYANYLGGETADGTLAIDEAADCVTLSRVFEMPLDVQSFMDNFARLVNAARYWADVIEKSFATSEDNDANILKV